MGIPYHESNFDWNRIENLCAYQIGIFRHSAQKMLKESAIWVVPPN